MLSSFYLDTAGSCAERTDRSEGVAFLKSVAALYELASASYVCLNLRHGKREGCYLHSNFSNRKIRQRTSGQPLGLVCLQRVGRVADLVESASDRVLFGGTRGGMIWDASDCGSGPRSRSSRHCSTKAIPSAVRTVVEAAETRPRLP